MDRYNTFRENETPVSYVHGCDVDEITGTPSTESINDLSRRIRDALFDGGGSLDPDDVVGGVSQPIELPNGKGKVDVPLRPIDYLVPPHGWPNPERTDQPEKSTYIRTMHLLSAIKDAFDMRAKKLMFFEVPEDWMAKWAGYAKIAGLVSKPFFKFIPKVGEFLSAGMDAAIAYSDARLQNAAADKNVPIGDVAKLLTKHSPTLLAWEQVQFIAIRQVVSSAASYTIIAVREDSVKTQLLEYVHSRRNARYTMFKGTYSKQHAEWASSDEVTKRILSAGERDNPVFFSLVTMVEHIPEGLYHLTPDAPDAHHLRLDLDVVYFNDKKKSIDVAVTGSGLNLKLDPDSTNILRAHNSDGVAITHPNAPIAIAERLRNTFMLCIDVKSITPPINSMGAITKDEFMKSALFKFMSTKTKKFS